MTAGDGTGGCPARAYRGRGLGLALRTAFAEAPAHGAGPQATAAGADPRRHGRVLPDGRPTSAVRAAWV